MGNDKEGKASDSKRGEGRKRLRDGGSQTDEEDLMASGRSTLARLDEMNAKLDKVLAVCGEIESLKKEIGELKGELKDLKESLEFAGKEIISLKAEMAETSTTVKENGEDMNSFDTDIEVLKRRNIKLEAYTRRENIRIYNIKEESDENTEEQVRNLFVAKLRIPQNDVDAIRFERVHRIPVKPSSQRSQSRGPRPVIVRFSHYQNKEFIRSFYKNLKGTKIGISDDFPREVEEIHKTLYPVLKQAKREQKRAFFNFDKLIINGQIYGGEETKNLPYYGNIMKNFV